MKTYKFKINNDKYVAKIIEYKGDTVIVEVNNGTYHVDIEHEVIKPSKLVRSKKPVSNNIPLSKPKEKIPSGAGSVVAPIPGQIHSLLVKEGDMVNEGDIVLILEAMKMESDIVAVVSGKVIKIPVKLGDNVQEGQVMLEIGE